MKNISLHKIDAPEVIERNFARRQKNYPEYITESKQIFRFLYFVFRDTTELLQMSVSEKPELSIQQYWFQYGINCISEFCRLAHFENETKEAVIDNGGTFKILVEDLNEFGDVKTSIQFARIFRNKEKEKHIASYPQQLLDLDRNITFSHEYINTLTRLEIEYSLTGNFNNEYYERLVDIYDKNKYGIQAKISSDTNYSLHYIHPYVIAFKSLVDDNEAEFNQNLIKALEAHKEVWSQKKALNRGGTPLCRENEGFLSWGCTALAAMAFDKGWELEVSSDYMPQFMVDGSINESI